jgi:hypothetical protein
MSKHITEWLNAYLDGELMGSRLHQVHEHLAECEACRAELHSLQDISALLHSVPSPEFTSPERLSAQVNLRLPHETPRVSRRRVQEVGWWMIPVSLLVIWVLLGTSAAVRDVVSTASRLGLLSGAPAWLVPSDEAIWTGTLGQFGILSGKPLQWAEVTESVTRETLPQFIWQASIAFLYLGWIVIWWAQRTRGERGQLLDGGSRPTAK